MKQYSRRKLFGVVSGIHRSVGDVDKRLPVRDWLNNDMNTAPEAIVFNTFEHMHIEWLVFEYSIGLYSLLSHKTYDGMILLLLLLLSSDVRFME